MGGHFFLRMLRNTVFLYLAGILKPRCLQDPARREARVNVGIFFRFASHVAFAFAFASRWNILSLLFIEADFNIPSPHSHQPKPYLFNSCVSYMYSQVPLYCLPRCETCDKSKSFSLIAADLRKPLAPPCRNSCLRTRFCVFSYHRRPGQPCSKT